MQTVNTMVNSETWTKVANSTEDFILSGAAKKFVDIALTNADAAPVGISGHSLLVGPGNEAVTRGVLGIGFVWAKLSLAESGAGAFVVVTK